MNDYKASPNTPDETLPTRRSLLSRLRNWNDNDSWNAFFETYWRLIYTTALKAGLTEQEAEEVVQETVLSVAKSMPDFKYDPAKGSFKGWLMKLTSWRITDQLRKRRSHIEVRRAHHRPAAETDTVNQVPDPTPPLEAIWDEEWETNLMQAAVERVKARVDPKAFQIFDLHVLRKWPISRVARTLNVSYGKVYLAKHRVSPLIKKQIAVLRSGRF